MLAIDCGASHASGLLIDATGTLIRSLAGGPANLHTHGPAGVAGVVRTLLAQAPEAEGLALGVAGLRTEDDAALLLAALGEAGIELPVAIFADTRIALRAGAAADGVVVVAGTGVAAYGRGSGREARAGGWGSVLGDEGGAFWLVSRLLRAGLRAHDEGDPRRAGILPALLAQAGFDDPLALRSLASGPEAVARIASCLPAAVALRNSDNALVRALLAEAASELARLAGLVAASVDLPAHHCVLLTGGMVAAFPELVEMVGPLLPHADVRKLTADPARGAYLLAREEGAWQTPALAADAATERENPAAVRIAEIPTLDVLALMNRGDAGVPGAVAGSLPALAELVDAVAARLAGGGRLIYIGAGTSGRLAMLDAVECVPTFGVEPGMVIALVAGGVAALTRAVEGAEDDSSAGRAAVDDVEADAQDAVVGISASGTAAYVLAGLERARTRGSLTALITCNPAASTQGRWRFRIVAPVGPEVITGSTRLKAGTAQKLILNMLSTAVMVRLGRTAGNRMVGLRPTNAKLRKRAVRLTCALSGATAEEAGAALAACDWDVTTAVLAIRTGDHERARALFARAGGNLARALQLAD